MFCGLARLLARVASQEELPQVGVVFERADLVAVTINERGSLLGASPRRGGGAAAVCSESRSMKFTVRSSFWRDSQRSRPTVWAGGGRGGAGTRERPRRLRLSVGGSSFCAALTLDAADVVERKIEVLEALEPVQALDPGDKIGLEVHNLQLPAVVERLDPVNVELVQRNLLKRREHPLVVLRLAPNQILGEGQSVAHGRTARRSSRGVGHAFVVGRRQLRVVCRVELELTLARPAASVRYRERRSLRSFHDYSVRVQSEPVRA